ncbi:hypothetical protein BE221DRAFT_215247 [Ostreococcus tauri]|uniref:FAD/NAD(P)-binding domain-containing protein n=1 Tax=Ostreococcus tauri TaxID=70448 RepID=A0A1Y5I696_OSTTA|nr:hypothetical protein BE221DRAFT_215247 [Ostreococcus tauri]
MTRDADASERRRTSVSVLVAITSMIVAFFAGTHVGASTSNVPQRGVDYTIPVAFRNDNRAEEEERAYRRDKATGDRDESVDYCILGAGPGGIQTGTYILRDIPSATLVVLEKRSSAGSFFQRFPIHRKLISINKRYFTEKQTDADFRLRHDWNSLIDPLDDAEPNRLRLLMQNYSDEYYPHASDLARYLDDFATEKLEGLVSYNTEVFSIAKEKTPTGLSAPTQLSAHFWHPKVIGYEQLTDDVSMFAGKRVAVLGAGNAGFETAAAISKVSAHTDIFASSEIRFAHQTHYPGALRIPNAAFLDQYLLKEFGLDDNDRRYDHVTAADHRRLWRCRPEDQGQRGHRRHHRIRDKRRCRALEYCFFYDYVIRAIGWKFDRTIFKQSTVPKLEKPGEVTKRGGKYPSMTATYESRNVPGLYFAGARSAGGFIHGFRYTSRALTRYLDVKNHGGSWPTVILRGSTHALMHASQRINTASSLYQMYGTLADVILIDATSTQNAYPTVNGVMEDAMRGARYHIDVPMKMLRDGVFVTGPSNETGRSAGGGFIVTITMEFGETFHGRFVVDHGKLENQRNLFLHPVLDCFGEPAAATVPVAIVPNSQPEYTVHLAEDLATDWTHPTVHRDVMRKFIRRAVVLANGVSRGSELGLVELTGESVFEAQFSSDFRLGVFDTIRALWSSRRSTF